MLHDSVSFTAEYESPRIIKTHLPMAMLPPDLLDTAKVLYIGRYIFKIELTFFNYHRNFYLHNFSTFLFKRVYVTRPQLIREKSIWNSAKDLTQTNTNYFRFDIKSQGYYLDY